MFVRMFLYADTKEEALRISDDVLRNLDARIDRKQWLSQNHIGKWKAYTRLALRSGSNNPLSAKR